MSTSPRDAGIPMLTEVIEDDAIESVGPPAPESPPFIADTAPAATASSYAPPLTGSDYAQPAAMRGQYGTPAQFAPSYPIPLKPAVPAMPAVVEAPAQPAVVQATLLPAAMSEDEWQRMERRVRERVLGQLLSRTDAMLEERIRASVAGVLQQAVDGLATTLRASLHKTLEDVVSRAVAQEISRLQSTKK